MDELTFDPSGYIRQLQQLLISDKKKIAFLFGAGTSFARKTEGSLFIPTIGGLTKQIEDELIEEGEYDEALREIKGEIGEEKYNIETLLSNLEQKRMVIAEGSLNGLNKNQISDLIDKIKDRIREKVSIHERISENHENLKNLIHCDFAEWIDPVDRKYPIEIFTTNYDYLFELGLEAENVPYYDGFTGGYEPFFNAGSVEDFDFLPYQTKLWKIHGSLGWHFNKQSKKVCRKNASQNHILIYPSTLKYSDSKKQPYISFLDRLNNFLKQDDAVLITCGYSFGDEHINERIITALNTNKSSHVYALYYDKYNQNGYYLSEDSFLSDIAKKTNKLSVYGCRSAVINCQYGKWKLKTEPSKSDTLTIDLFFDEDGFDSEKEKNVEKTGEEIWNGEGQLILPDFSKFAIFLKSMITTNK
jgi:hypothetical protein